MYIIIIILLLLYYAIYIYIYTYRKVADHSRGQSEGYLFKSCYTEL